MQTWQTVDHRVRVLVCTTLFVLDTHLSDGTQEDLPQHALHVWFGIFPADHETIIPERE
jgi:hypothetical protein